MTSRTASASSHRRRLAVALLALGAALALPAMAADETGSSWSFAGFTRVTGSGNLKSETRNVSGFQGVALRGSVKVVLRQGAREGVELRADDNLLPLIETVVVDHGGTPTLEIGVKKGTSYSSKQPIVATVDVVNLRALAISGSADVSSDALKTPTLAIAISGSGSVRVRQLAADELNAKVSGSGDLQFGGRAAKLGLAISGSGDVDARGLEADDVSVSVAGSGDASVTARKTLAVSIAGNGSVVYAGDAVVKTSIAGHGTVRKQ